jgi:hypothetical protein
MYFFKISLTSKKYAFLFFVVEYMIYQPLIAMMQPTHGRHDINKLIKISTRSGICHIFFRPLSSSEKFVNLPYVCDHCPFDVVYMTFHLILNSLYPRRNCFKYDWKWRACSAEEIFFFKSRCILLFLLWSPLEKVLYSGLISRTETFAIFSFSNQPRSVEFAEQQILIIRTRFYYTYLRSRF